MLRLSGRGHRPTTGEVQAIEAAAASLTREFPELAECHVVLSVPVRTAGGEPGAVSFRLGLTLDDAELALTRPAKPDFATALTDAFSAARLQLADYRSALPARRDTVTS